MRGLIRYLLKNYAFLLFLLLEVFSFILIFNFNSYQKAQYLNSSNKVTGTVYNTYNAVGRYFSLASVNRKLASENAKLKSLISDLPYIRVTPYSVVMKAEVTDSVYRFISARVINNSVDKQNNYITLNKGRKHGIKPDQGIINSEGIVGVITTVSESYSLGFSVLNKRWGASAKLKKSGTFGPLSWDGNDSRFASLTGIPFHVELAVGDTVVTSSYSSVFPEGIMIGTVHSLEKPAGENYYNINVMLSVNFRALSYVDVVENLKKDEIKALESKKADDPDNQ
ncbi:MAG TPA: rod shape-determining protein MreC [Draconibacterium sp.]|jgi:rod shape-determining protein MreC|nr:rod shape-determining protein MreC [Draconibacterium sp.]